MANKNQHNDKYILLKNREDGSISLQNGAEPISENAETLFSFEAPNYNMAMAIQNKFLNLEPYIPMAESIAATRTLTLFDENKKPLNKVTVLVYQPVKSGEDQWLCEYHINIEYNGTNAGTEDLGGYNIIGFDMIQALQNAFLLIDSIISAYNQSHNNKIFWLEYGKDCGFIKKRR